MTVKHLRALLANVPDEALVVVPDRDHNYRKADVRPGVAICEKGGALTEDYPELQGVRTHVLVVS